MTVSELSKKERRTGTVTKWRPDLDVFTDIAIPLDYYLDMLKKQSVVNAGTTFRLKWQTAEGFEEYEFVYRNGIVDLGEFLRDTVLFALPSALFCAEGCSAPEYNEE